MGKSYKDFEGGIKKYSRLVVRKFCGFLCKLWVRGLGFALWCKGNLGCVDVLFFCDLYVNGVCYDL